MVFKTLLSRQNSTRRADRELISIENSAFEYDFVAFEYYLGNIYAFKYVHNILFHFKPILFFYTLTKFSNIIFSIHSVF